MPSQAHVVLSNETASEALHLLRLLGETRQSHDGKDYVLLTGELLPGDPQYLHLRIEVDGRRAELMIPHSFVLLISIGAQDGILGFAGKPVV